VAVRGCHCERGSKPDDVSVFRFCFWGGLSNGSVKAPTEITIQLYSCQRINRLLPVDFLWKVFRTERIAMNEQRPHPTQGWGTGRSCDHSRNEVCIVSSPVVTISNGGGRGQALTMRPIFPLAEGRTYIAKTMSKARTKSAAKNWDTGPGGGGSGPGKGGRKCGIMSTTISVIQAQTLIVCRTHRGQALSMLLCELTQERYLGNTSANFG
jgi:hypothetical protein